MKHLRYFESLSTDKFIPDIEDILSDLTDNGFNIDVKSISFRKINIIITKNQITSAGGKTIFRFDSNIDETISRLQDYCDINKLKFDVYDFRIVTETSYYSNTEFVKYKDISEY